MLGIKYEKHTTPVPRFQATESGERTYLFVFFLEYFILFLFLSLFFVCF